MESCFYINGIPVFFNFQFEYDKMGKDEFTTIRSVNYTETHPWVKVDKVGYATLRNKPFSKIILVGFSDRKICDIPLKILQDDANSKKDCITIHNTGEFVDLLNRFSIISCGYGNNRLETLKRVFYLKKII